MAEIDYNAMTDDELAIDVAKARGCQVATSLYGMYCPCPGMPHGMLFPPRPGADKGAAARLHKFPRDVSMAIIREKRSQEIKHPDGVTVCKFLVDMKGRMRMIINNNHAFQSYEFAVLMRGGAAEMDDYYEGECRYHSKQLNRFERDMDNLMGGADGVGTPAS